MASIRHWLGSRSFYLASLALIAFSLTVSPFGISVGTFLLAASWLAGPPLRERWQRLRQRPSLLLFISIFFLCLIGMTYTSNLHFGLHDIIIKLPLLVLPLILGTSTPLSMGEGRVLLAALLAGLWVSSLTALGVLLGWIDHPFRDIREISIFISHIRLSLILGVTLQAVLYLLLRRWQQLTKAEKVFYLFSISWFPFFLFILKSLTGFLMLTLLLASAYLLLLQKARGFMLRYFLIILGVTIVLLSAAWLSRATDRFYRRDTLPGLATLGTTANGNPYDPPANLEEVENGHYVWLYVCEKELRRAWNHASPVPYDSLDQAGQPLRTTLIRYMSSKGLRKDSLGFSRMSPEDIRNVERGMTNHLFSHRLALYPYFYVLLWEWEQYKKGGLSGHSHIQRLAYLRTGWHIARDHLWTGVGTGDVPDTFKKYYRQEKSPLSPEWQLRAHNQYLTYWITYGIFGALWFLVAFFAPFFMERGYRNFFALVFIIIAALSMLYEDTLETQAGVYFVAFFYAWFIFGMAEALPVKPEKYGNDGKDNR